MSTTAINMSRGPLLVGIESTGLTPADRTRLSHPAVGGVVLFTRNYASPDQLADLCADIHSLRRPHLIITVDQEGGRVQRFRDGFVQLPPLAVLGRLYDRDRDHGLDFAYRHGRVMAAELRARGVDLSFAPVLDLLGPSEVIGDRALHPEPAVVAALGRAYVAGMKDAGMVAVGKHFPGHGTVTPDTHTEDAVDKRPIDILRQRDLRPFAELADELAGMMMAHVCYSAVDSHPAGYSAVWIERHLRQELGFDGVVLSDDLDMQAACVVGGLPERLQTALDAGCDLALVCQPASADALLAALGDDAVADRWPGADTALERLAGRACLSRSELDAVSEWRQWSASLDALNSSSMA